MTRIIAGAAGGRRLVTPPGDLTRPSSDRVREALFSVLQSRGVLAAARVVDLFAGSGALGLEAASRGAAEVTLVDSSARAAAAARANAATVGEDLVDTVVVVVCSTVARFLRREAGSAAGAPGWDLVLLDPPYALGETELAQVLAGVADNLAPDGLVVVERSRRSPAPEWPTGLRAEPERRYGDTSLWIAAGEGR